MKGDGLLQDAMDGKTGPSRMRIDMIDLGFQVRLHLAGVRLAFLPLGRAGTPPALSLWRAALPLQAV